MRVGTALWFPGVTVAIVDFSRPRFELILLVEQSLCVPQVTHSICSLQWRHNALVHHSYANPVSLLGNR